jgi:type IV secretion system protein VirD4
MKQNEMKKKQLLVFAGFILFGLVGGMIMATQHIAALCGYDPALGNAFQIDTYTVYWPWSYFLWTHNPALATLIPDILHTGEKYIYLGAALGFGISYLITKNMSDDTTHGSADWSEFKEIKKMELASGDGVVLGINPFTHTLLTHNGPQHILLMAPTRSGKGICVIIPTLLTWRHSVFVTDVKGENFDLTGAFRKKILHQNVMKFEPLCADGSSARWNPLAEINFRTVEEVDDIQTLAETIANPEGTVQKDPYWNNSSVALLQGVILHLLYSYRREGRNLPTLTDIIRFLTKPEHEPEQVQNDNNNPSEIGLLGMDASEPRSEMTIKFDNMRRYPHISPEEFLSDDNVLQNIYGEYILDFTPYSQQLQCKITSLEELKANIRDRNIDWTAEPWCFLLVHPKVAECGSNLANLADQTRSGIISTTMTALKLYQNPVVQRNISCSDFCVQDLLDPEQEISLYLIIPAMALVDKLKPLCRLLINTILNKLIRDIDTPIVNDKLKAAAKIKKKQRLLLMLDEFPQFGNFPSIEMALAVCAGYGIKMCIVSQDINQLNKAYTANNSIMSNCHIHVYFTPNFDGNKTAKMISEQLGNKTIKAISRSQGRQESTTISSAGQPLMTPDEVSRLSADKEIVFMAGQRPIMGDKLRYYKHAGFRNRCLAKPLLSDSKTLITDFESLMAYHKKEAEARMEKAQQVLAAKKEEEKNNEDRIKAQQTNATPGSSAADGDAKKDAQGSTVCDDRTFADRERENRSVASTEEIEDELIAAAAEHSLQEEVKTE